ncbi:MAG: YdcF family protein [Treponema sp.]|nr:YdcF family protein [Treponema sp.]
MKILKSITFKKINFKGLPHLHLPENLSRLLKKLFFAGFFTGIVIFLGALAINIYMIQYSKPYIYSDFSTLPKKYTVIVPGARVYKNNISFVVRDRLEAASTCINGGKAQKVLISGDHGTKEYDEVNRMRLYMQNIYKTAGEIIFLDHAGFSTYETMYRAKEIFCVNNAVVVTQRFHLTRSVYIAKKMGIDIVGFEAKELNPYSAKIHRSWTIRESLARVKTFFLVLFKTKPTYLGQIIPITGDSSASWDMIK